MADRREQARRARRQSARDKMHVRVIALYRRKARVKGIPFALSWEDMVDLLDGDCDYGGRPPALTRPQSRRGGYWYETPRNGIDRLVNHVGYVPGTVVSCCKECTYKKGAPDYEAFMAWVRCVYEHRGG